MPIGEKETQFHLQRLATLKSDRTHWDSQWDEAAARIIPAHKNTFLSQGIDQQYNLGGRKKTEDLFDATAALACQRFASVIESLSTPQSGMWHRLVPIDKTLKKNRAVREWFDNVTDLLFSYRYRPVANFVGNSQQVYQSLGAYGNGSVFIDAPENTPGLRYRNVHLGETYFVENHAGVVDTVYRVLFLDARQAVQKFGKACPERIAKMAENPNTMQQKHEFLHCVYPREDRDLRSAAAQDMPFASLYFSVSDKKSISEGGFRTFPFAISRYTQSSGEVYGRGPAQWVLPSIKLLNEQKKAMIKQAHRQVDPVLLAFDDGVLDHFSLRAGAINKGGVSAEGRPLVQPLPVGNIVVAEKAMEVEQRVINDAFLITLFQILVDAPQMSATEVLERAREKGMLVAPTAGRQQAEFLGPLIEREIDLLIAQNLLPPIPPVLLEAGGAYKVEYDSPMSRMQRAEKAAGFFRALGVAADYARQTGDPSPLDFFDFDVAMPEILDIHGAPVAWTRAIEDVQAIREQREEQAQQAAMLQNAGGMAQVAKALPEVQKMAKEGRSF